VEPTKQQWTREERTPLAVVSIQSRRRTPVEGIRVSIDQKMDFLAKHCVHAGCLYCVACRALTSRCARVGELAVSQLEDTTPQVNLALRMCLLKACAL
jgi:hypothetical protein